MAMRVSGLNSGLDTDSIVQELVSAYSKKTEKYTKEQTKLGWKQEIWKGLNTKVYSLYNSVGKMRYSNAYNTRKTTTSDATKATVTAGSNAVNGTQKLNVLSTAQSGYLTSGKIKAKDNSTVTADTKMKMLGFENESGTLHLSTKDKEGKAVEKDISITADTSISDVIKQLQDTGVNASFDEKNGRIFISSKDTGEDSDFTISISETKMIPKLDSDGNVMKDEKGNQIMQEVSRSDAEIASGKKALGLLGLDTQDNSYGEKATKIDGTDAVIVLSGMMYTSSTNDFSINGLDITVHGVTDDIESLKDSNGDVDISKINTNNSITLQTSTDTQGLYDSIKDFLTEYNNIINEITKLYNADSAGSYEPLTDDEKDKMSDTEIEKWETKIKDSLLRRDNSLSSVMNAMMTSMSQSININGKDYSLSSFGIHTLGYLNAVENEQNAYHIDGDEDDENTSGNEDKLMAALSGDPELVDSPDTVVEFMKQLSTNLYKAIDEQMQSSSLRSRFKIYNDKELDKQYRNYTKTIKEWESKVSDKEDYYYKKFSQMETALSKLQSQTNSISGLLGN